VASQRQCGAWLGHDTQGGAGAAPCCLVGVRVRARVRNRARLGFG
jgi:hypothetical protein